MVFIKITLHWIYPEERLQSCAFWPLSENMNCINFLGVCGSKGDNEAILQMLSPLGNTLVTTSNDCLYIFVPTHLKWRIITLWRAKSWSCRFNLCSAKLPIVMIEGKIMIMGWVPPVLRGQSVLWDSVLSIRAALSLAVERHLLMLEEDKTAKSSLGLKNTFLLYSYSLTKYKYRSVSHT